MHQADCKCGQILQPFDYSYNTKGTSLFRDEIVCKPNKHRVTNTELLISNFELDLL